MKNCSLSKINITRITSNITSHVTNVTCNNTTSNNIHNIIFAPKKPSTVEIASLSVITFMIIVGNALVILAYFNGPRRLRTRTNFFVINLAVSDIMVGLISLPFWITVLLGIVFENMLVYKCLITLDVLFGSVSIFSLSAISLERMYAVRYPANHHNLNDTPFFVTIIMTWLIGVVMTSLRFAVAEKPYTILILLVIFLLPLVIIVFCYFVIFYTARTMFVATNQEGNLSRDLQVAKTISIIIGLFVVCWLPFFTINVVYYYGSDSAIHFIKTNAGPLMSLTKGLHYSNSMMNFFVYAVKSPDFRETFKELLCNRFDGKVVRERLQTMSIAGVQLRNSLRVERLSKSLNSNGGSSSLLSKTTSLNQSASSSGSFSLLDGRKLPPTNSEEDCVFG